MFVKTASKRAIFLDYYNRGPAQEDRTDLIDDFLGRTFSFHLFEEWLDRT